MNNLSVVILAAGKGTRMRSKRPKVLHTLGSCSLLEHVVSTAESLSPSEIIVVYGHGGESIKEQLAHLKVTWVEQQEQLGTGHAVQQAIPAIDASHNVLVLYGDVPLTQETTLHSLIVKLEQNSKILALMTDILDDSEGYGRIVRDQYNRVIRIVEQKDASPKELQIKEINTGILAVSAKYLHTWLNALKNNNAQQEYYLTDIIAMAVKEDVLIETTNPGFHWETLGVNDKRQLAELERVFQLNIATKLMSQGVCLRDPNRLDLRGSVEVGVDVSIDVNVLLEGDVILGDDVNIGANCIIRNSSIGVGSVIEPNSIVDASNIGAYCTIGPFARIRPDTILSDHVKVGNFVEIKKSKIRDGSKVNHLSYIGDTDMGKNVNIGAGTITCNYDGANKHVTIIHDDVFVGSDSQLIAPVTLGKGSTIGAGSTIAKNTPENELSLTRSRQQSIAGWRRPLKKTSPDNS